MATSEESGQRNDWVVSGRSLWLRSGLVFLLALVVFTALYATSPLIYDADSYYHLALARGYAEEGLFDRLEWVRFGLLSEQFGDKELLFHVLLMPFAAWMEPMLGGRLALTLLGAAILAVIAWLSLRAIGSWGMLVPFWLLLGSLEFTWRLVRLRPELASLVVLLLALWAATRRRYIALALLSLVYALTYTAIHAYLGIFVLIFLAQGWALQRWDPRLVLYPLLGAGIGLVVHPQFPNNLVVWWYQSVEYFRFKGTLDVGNEIQPMRTDLALLVNLGWWVGMAALWRAAAPSSTPRRADASVNFGVAAAAFGVLYVMMSRFALYFMVLATLWMLFEIHRRGWQLGDRVRLPWRGSMPLSVAWVLVFLLSLPVASYELGRYLHRNSPGPDDARIVDREAFSKALPNGAKVANPWRSTPIYMFWAPQARYLNVLDPVFLAAHDPEVHRAQREIFSGLEPDVPLVAYAFLDSDYVAYNAATGNPQLTQRLVADPRVESSHQGIQRLFRIRPPANSPFVLDWRLIPSRQSLPATAVDIDEWPLYPLAEDARLRLLEGYINARRTVGAGECLALVHRVVLEEALEVALEFAPMGPASLWVDEAKKLDLRAPQGAILGQGAVLPVELAAGEHRITVLSCPHPESDRNGFYLLERSGG